MNKTTKDFEDEQKGVYAALCRAALKAKQEAERNGTPYVVYRGSNNRKALDEKQTNAKAK
jgi:hypothetical protein